MFHNQYGGRSLIIFKYNFSIVLGLAIAYNGFRLGDVADF
jgi:hypothetical protein